MMLIDIPLARLRQMIRDNTRIVGRDSPSTKILCGELARRLAARPSAKARKRGAKPGKTGGAA